MQAKGDRCYVSDLPLLEIGFGDIRNNDSVVLPIPPPAAEPAIMPGMSDDFSIKIPTVHLPSPLLSWPRHPTLYGLLSTLLLVLRDRGDTWCCFALHIPIDEDRGN